jgi:voltage-gated potassium channel
MRGHVVVCGYGTKGRNAIRALMLKGCTTERIVVVDADPQALAEATAAGFVTVAGPCTRPSVLREALVQRAEVVVVALGRDDTAVLVTLAARRLNPDVTVVSTVREAENAELLRQSGASSVIVSSETAGRLLGLAADSPDTVDVVEDLLSFGTGLDLVEREVHPDEVGRAPRDLVPPVLAVVRGHRRLYYNDPEADALQRGDRLVQAEITSPNGATLPED